MSDLADEAYAAALSGLPGMGPATLCAILSEYPPREAWANVVAGVLDRPTPTRRRGPIAGQLPLAGCAEGVRQGRQRGDRWSDAARRLDVEAWWAAKRAHGIRATWPGDADYPEVLRDDPSPPGVLFWRGSLEWLQRPCVALVGTRSATPDGRAVAFGMGRDLAAAGVCVVSGLALGIDGAAHEGALRSVEQPGAAGPVGVAASGVDIPYPRRHAVLWQRVVDSGAVLSETLPGRPAEAWRFPSRNRIIAGLSRMVVVVESHVKGGSLITADAAIERGLEVRAVPGPVRSPASSGTNQLLYDGPGPVRDARDVLDALGMILPDAPETGAGPAGSGARGGRGRAAASRHRDLDPPVAAVLGALAWRPMSLNQIVRASGVSAAHTARVLDELKARGLAADEGGWWVRTA